MSYYQKSYYPRRPVKSFQDLEVYQRLLAASVAINKKIKSEKITAIALNLPLWIAEAHSIRFSAPQAAIDKLEQTMLGCNQAVVCLEQYRDIENKDIEVEFFEEQIKSLLVTRTKVMHLQMSWKKFLAIKQKEQNV